MLGGRRNYMGLDMWVYATKGRVAKVDMKKEPKDKKEVYYWRKHHDLHDWFHALYTKKGGKDPDFNCNSVSVVEEDLDRLECQIMDETVYDNAFTNYIEDKAEYVLMDLDFVKKAKDHIKGGFNLWFTSWW
jgi:hypothetical protein